MKLRIAAIIALLVRTAAAALLPSTISLQISGISPSNLGQAVTLTATASPAAATGAVTFYDGASVLGVSAISVGQASFTTSLLRAGPRSLKAYYSGDANFAPSSSAPLSLTVAALGQNGFQAPVSYGGISFPLGLAVGDFNGDGYADLVATDSDTNKMSVFLGNGDGTFKAPVSYPTGVAPSAVVVADINGDGHADIVVTDGATAASTVSVFFGNGDGTFKAVVNYPTDKNPQQIAVADFNGDGFADLAVSNFGGNDVSILLGKGDGTFKSAVSYTVTAAWTIAAGDFNGDGRTDLVVATFGGTTVGVLLGNGDGTFKAPVTYSVGSSPGSITVVDVNGDGKLDLVVAVKGSIDVLLGVGDGFKTPVSYSVSGAVAVGDFNGDGRLDLAVADGSVVNVLPGVGDGTFLPPVKYPAGPNPSGIVAGEFNGDGRSDLAALNFVPAGVNILLGTPVYSDLTITIAENGAGNFAQGQTGAVYTITVGNSGPRPTSGAVVVTDTLPAGLTAVSMAGTGWNCALATLICSRSDALAVNAMYPAISLTANIAANASASLVNTASVSGGGEMNTANNTAVDTAPVAPSGPVIATTSLPPGVNGADYSQMLSAAGGSPPYTWMLVSGDLPDGLTLTPDGTIAGTPDLSGTSTFMVGITDSAGASATQTLSLTIADQVDSSAAGSRVKVRRRR